MTAQEFHALMSREREYLQNSPPLYLKPIPFKLIAPYRSVNFKFICTSDILVCETMWSELDNFIKFPRNEVHDFPTFNIHHVFVCAERRPGMFRHFFGVLQ